MTISRGQDSCTAVGIFRYYAYMADVRNFSPKYMDNLFELHTIGRIRFSRNVSAASDDRSVVYFDFAYLLREQVNCVCWACRDAERAEVGEPEQYALCEEALSFHTRCCHALDPWHSVAGLLLPEEQYYFIPRFAHIPALFYQYRPSDQPFTVAVCCFG